MLDAAYDQRSVIKVTKVELLAEAELQKGLWDDRDDTKTPLTNSKDHRNWNKSPKNLQILGPQPDHVTFQPRSLRP